MADDGDALVPVPLDPDGFNSDVKLPYGLLSEHVGRAMQDFLNFLGYINEELHSRDIARQELLMEPAGFSGLVGGFMVSGLPKHCPTLAKNNYHNGHPDMLPKGRYPGDSIAHANEGIEVKASRRPSSWQGHNPEASWLMVFQYDSNKAADLIGEVEPRPFRFVQVTCARLEEADWTFAGRSETSKRTITATINKSGMQKLRTNWISRVP